MVTNCVACYGYDSMFIISLYYQHSKDLSGFYWCPSVEGLMNLLVFPGATVSFLVPNKPLFLYWNTLWLRNCYLNCIIEEYAKCKQGTGNKEDILFSGAYPKQIVTYESIHTWTQKAWLSQGPLIYGLIILNLHCNLLSYQKLNLQIINHDWYGSSINSVGSAGVPCAEVLPSLQQPWVRVRARPQVQQNTYQISWPSINLSRPLKSAGSGALAVHTVKTKHGEAAFSFSAPQMWHKFPAEKHRLETMLLL